MRHQLLGPLQVVRDGVTLDLGSPKQRAVLAVLLFNRGRVVSTDRLVDAVWEQDAPPSATASLQAYISNLRRALRDPAAATSPIVRQPPGYLLDVPAGDVDVARFLELIEQARNDPDRAVALARADEALAMWRGPAEDAAERWSSEDAAQWWEAAITAYDLLPANRQLGSERDDLLVARVEALARVGRGQVLLDVGNTGCWRRSATTAPRAPGGWPRP